MIETGNQELPELIILIPHYNNLNALHKSLLSIVEDFEYDILIVDDGSQNPPLIDDFINVSSARKTNILKMENNMGIAHALNLGLDWIYQRNYKYIARLDCGDLCVKNRFVKQRQFLNSNPEIKLLGTQVNFISINGSLLYSTKLPLKHSEIKKALYKNCVIIHPTIMFHSDIIKVVGMYPTNYFSAEDYAFFFKVAKNFKINNLNETLVDVIIDPDGISVKNRRLQFMSKIKIIYHNFYFGLTPIIGLLRNAILMVLPFKIAHFIKRNIYK